jgi:hypothetical protein
MIRLAKAGNVACIVGLDKKTQSREEENITVLTVADL